MRPRFLLLCLVLLPGVLRAEAAAPAGGGTCVSANLEPRPHSPGVAALHRIVFMNRCEQPRTLFWCAENAAAPVPAEIACPRTEEGRGFAVELRHSLRLRKEFQWYLPPGTRIRFRDCPAEELPTSDFGCVAPSAAGAPRR